MGITKPCTHLHPPPPSSFQPPSSSLQHPQQYLNQNIARHWAIFPNLGWKIKSFPFWLKISARGILEVLISNLDLDFWNSDPKTHFRANLGPKIQSCPFCLKIGTLSISRMLILNPDLNFWNFDAKINFWTNWAQKSKLFVLSENWYSWYLKDADSYFNLVFWISNPYFLFGQIWSKSVKVVPINWKLAHIIS